MEDEHGNGKMNTEIEIIIIIIIFLLVVTNSHSLSYAVPFCTPAQCRIKTGRYPA